MPTRPRREKRIHRQHDEQCCRWILFCGSAKRALGVREKRGGKRAGGGASRAPHRREGTESGVAWNEKERRCVVEARGDSKRRTGESTRHAENRKGARENRKGARESRKTKGAQSKNKESPNQSVGAEIRKSAGFGIRKRTGRGIRRRAICPPPCRDEEFG